MLLKSSYASLAGISACVPVQVEKNADYDYVSEAERQLFIQTTGVKERRVSSKDVCASDLCFAAAQKLINELNWKKDEISLLIFVSQSPDYFLPATAVILQNRLELTKNTMAFDINLGCSGYVYGMSVISSLMENPGMNKALLLVGDKSTISLNPRDKTAFPLFGDAGSATAFERKENTIYYNLQSDGEGKNAIIIPGGGTRNRYYEGILKDNEIEPGVFRNKCNLHLDGMEVFNFALKEVKSNIEALYSFAAKKPEETDYFIFHQANKLINESVRKKMKIIPEKVPYSIDRFGNTSSASIPLTLVTELSDQIRNRKLNLLFSGFGVGYSWGSVLVQTEKICCPDLIEI